MTDVRYPALYQINTRVRLTELSRALGRRATLDDIPDADLDRLSESGFDWIWFLSVWQTGSAAQKVSRANPEWRREFAETLPDLGDEDIAGSGFAIQSYTVHRGLGGDAALARLRERLQKRGLKLMLDFVPNHMAPDHPWLDEHPDYFVPGSESDLARSPRNYCRVQSKKGSLLLAYGRDPYFDGWPDTLQLNYGNPQLQQAMIGELTRIAGQCDGVRCDMAMLVLPDVFERTWGIRPDLFWPKATESVRRKHPGFVFMAEVYWDLEWTMQQQGFDYAYDKRLYDRLREGHARPVREHLRAGLDYQDKLARFLENHDEPRAAATFARAMHEAAAVVTFLSPGLRFFHQGQFDGRRKRISPHLVRAPEEPVDAALRAFYQKLLGVLQQPVFFYGLGLIALGSALLVGRTLFTLRPGRFWSDAVETQRFGIWLAAIIGAIALGSFVTSWMTQPLYTGQALYEAVFWGGGHALQFQHGLLMVVVWFWLASELGHPPRLPPHR